MSGCAAFSCTRPAGLLAYDFSNVAETSLLSSPSSFGVAGVACMPGYAVRDGETLGVAS